MPLKRGTSKKVTDQNFHEFRGGNVFSRTRKKFGAKVAHKQMIAAVLSNKRKSGKRARKKG